MTRKPPSFVVLLALLAGTAAAQPSHQHATPPSGPPPLFGNLGSWTHRITTGSSAAQRYFDQGLNLAYGFNYDEAGRAFREAARLDPTCAMAWWGVALVSGPHINMPAMDESQVRSAWEAIGRAQSLAAGASEVERAYISALARRYVEDPGADRVPLDSAYAGAMRSLASRHPDDADAQVLCAESLLDLAPWNQWSADGRALPGTEEIVAILERTLKRWPDHPGANHLYVHALEASPHPEKALTAAGRLEKLVPGAGHLVHMPGHIYARVDRFGDARRVNERAVAVDEAYIAKEKPQGFYPMMYYNHNVHFIWFASTMEGRSAEAMAAARKLAGNVPPEMVRRMGMIEFFAAVPYFSMVRFGRWDEILATPAPPSDLRLVTYAWHFARGMAQSARGDFAAADVALDSIRAIATSAAPDWWIGTNLAPAVLRVGLHALAGAIAMHQQDLEEAVTELELGVAAEDSLRYDEPPTWPYPVRHSLGAALLRAGRGRDAEAVYREDQRRHPGNGWSLFGLSQALEAQGRKGEASRARQRFRKAWSGADVMLPGSVF